MHERKVADRFRWMPILVAVSCAVCTLDAQAIPITTTSTRIGSQSIWMNSVDTERSGDFVIVDNSSRNLAFAKFDSTLGTLLNVELKLTSTIAHPTQSFYSPYVPYIPGPSGSIGRPFGAWALDSAWELHGFLDLWALYDASVAYRADFRMRVDALNANLFTATANEAAFGSCSIVEDLFLDIGNTDPHCFAGNNGAPLDSFNYSWGPVTGADLAQFIGNDALLLQTSLLGNAYGSCDNDVGDVCRLLFATQWLWDLQLSYTYEPTTDGGDGGDGGDSGGGDGTVDVAEPAGLGVFALACFAFAGVRRLRDSNKHAR